MLVFYVWRLRLIWSSFPCWFMVEDWAIQIGRMLIDLGGGHGIAWGWRGQFYHLFGKGRS